MSKRLVVHAIVAILFWILFGYYWWLVSRRQVTVETLRAVQTLLIITAGVWVVTAAWMEHNRRLFGRGKPDRRSRRRAVDHFSEKDSVGRMVTVGEAIDNAAYVEVDIDEASGTKHFVPMDPPDLTETNA